MTTGFGATASFQHEGSSMGRCRGGAMAEHQGPRPEAMWRLASRIGGRQSRTRWRGFMAQTTASKRGSRTNNPVGEWLRRALADGRALLANDGARQRITYVAIDLVESYDDP